jgi:hypothetical protein
VVAAGALAPDAAFVPLPLAAAAVAAGCKPEPPVGGFAADAASVWCAGSVDLAPLAPPHAPASAPADTMNNNPMRDDMPLQDCSIRAGSMYERVKVAAAMADNDAAQSLRSSDHGSEYLVQADLLALSARRS